MPFSRGSSQPRDRTYYLYKFDNFHLTSPNLGFFIYKTRIINRPIFGLCWELQINSCKVPSGDFQVAFMVKNMPATAGGVRDIASIPRSRRSPGGRHGNQLQYSWLENPTDRGAWWATVHCVSKSRTQLSNWTTTRHFKIKHIGSLY